MIDRERIDNKKISVEQFPKRNPCGIVLNFHRFGVSAVPADLLITRSAVRSVGVSDLRPQDSVEPVKVPLYTPETASRQINDLYLCQKIPPALPFVCVAYILPYLKEKRKEKNTRQKTERIRDNSKTII